MGADAVIRIVIADDHPGVRVGLIIMMESYTDIRVIGEAANGEEAVTLCEQLQPDLVLMDLNMPRMDGISATKIVRQRFPQIKVLMLTFAIERDVMNAAISAGAGGYLNKSVSSDVIIETIRAIRHL